MTEELLKQQKLDSDETIITQQSVSDSHLAELQEKIQQMEATNKVWSISPSPWRSQGFLRLWQALAEVLNLSE